MHILLRLSYFNSKCLWLLFSVSTPSDSVDPRQCIRQQNPSNMFGTIIAFILFTLEWYHIWGHTVILFRIRLLPRKDLVRIRYYFLFDLLTVFCSSILFTGKLRWLAVIQIIQHLYYFVYWDQTGLAKKVL